MLKCIRWNWSAWVVYHVWKIQIRKEIKEAESEKEKSDLRRTNNKKLDREKSAPVWCLPNTLC